MLKLAAEFDRTPPETRRALLYCREEHRPRMHGYMGKVPVLARPRSSLRRDKVRVDRVDNVFECEACGASRVWGNTPAFPHAPPPVRRSGSRAGEARAS